MAGPPDPIRPPPSVGNLLRLEGAAVLGGAIVLYASAGHPWLVFFVLFFAPDLAMLGYTANPSVGATTYNLAHTYVLPALIAALGWWTGTETAMAVALIWAGHIGLDRMLGYGLKLPTGFRHTHLGTIGRR